MYTEEYFCPNCGAILNNQSGFDPNNSVWTCTECGMLLMDDDMYEGDRFEGVVWYCDNCNAILNKQSGFSDSNSYWQCEECGHTNPISESEILDSADVKLCPNCHSCLNKQSSYYDGLDHTCESCGESLYRDYYSDDFSIDDRLRCPNCGDILEKQFNYYSYLEDYVCDNCYSKLHRDYTSDGFEVVNDETEDTEDYICDIDEDTYVYSNSHNKKNNENFESKNTNRGIKKEQTEPEDSKKHNDIKWAFLLMILPLIIGLGMIAKFEVEEWVAKGQGKISAGYYQDLVGEDYKAVEAHFEAAGFTHITLIDLNDSGILFWKKDKVKMISIAGNNSFDTTDWFEPDDEVVITYH